MRMILLVLCGIIVGLPLGCIVRRAWRTYQSLQGPRRAIRGPRVDRSLVRDLRDVPRGQPSDYSPEALRALAYWLPPRDGRLRLIASVHLGERFLFCAIDPHDSPQDISCHLDIIAHCLLATGKPDLDGEWIQKLKSFGDNLEQKLED
jgi:hypothetical protein